MDSSFCPARSTSWRVALGVRPRTWNAFSVSRGKARGRGLVGRFKCEPQRRENVKEETPATTASAFRFASVLRGVQGCDHAPPARPCALTPHLDRLCHRFRPQASTTVQRCQDGATDTQPPASHGATRGAGRGFCPTDPCHQHPSHPCQSPPHRLRGAPRFWGGRVIVMTATASVRGSTTGPRDSVMHLAGGGEAWLKCSSPEMKD